jgi:outer membrane protein assembly factor BamE (lipoprotein component of BamABCDE complex)
MDDAKCRAIKAELTAQPEPEAVPIGMRRRYLLFGLLAAMIALVAGTCFLWPRTSAITEENYAKIRVGMTREEVEAVLGGPAGNYGFYSERIVQTRDDIDVPRLAECRYLQWIDSRHMIGIQFDAEHRVVGKDFGEVIPLPLWRQALVWLRRQHL